MLTAKVRFTARLPAHQDEFIEKMMGSTGASKNAVLANLVELGMQKIGERKGKIGEKKYSELSPEIIALLVEIFSRSRVSARNADDGSYAEGTEITNAILREQFGIEEES